MVRGIHRASLSRLFHVKRCTWKARARARAPAECFLGWIGRGGATGCYRSGRAKQAGPFTPWHGLGVFIPAAERDSTIGDQEPGAGGPGGPRFTARDALLPGFPGRSSRLCSQILARPAARQALLTLIHPDPATSALAAVSRGSRHPHQVHTSNRSPAAPSSTPTRSARARRTVSRETGSPADAVSRSVRWSPLCTKVRQAYTSGGGTSHSDPVDRSGVR